MTPEAKVKAQVKKVLDVGGHWYCMPMGTGYGRSGVPDIIACVRGHFVALECKAGKGRTTALQDREMERIQAAEGSAFVIDENNVATLPHLLETF